MSRRLIVILLIGAAAIGWVYLAPPLSQAQKFNIRQVAAKIPGLQQIASPNITTVSSIRIDNQFPSFVIVPAVDLLRYKNAAYRLKPDRRFLSALERLEVFFSGSSNEISAKFENNRWSVRSKNSLLGIVPTDDTVLGEVPELPDFDDFMKLLVRRVQTLNAEFPLNLQKSSVGYPEIKKKLDEFFSPSMFSLGREINKLWESGNRDPALLYYSAKALTNLQFQLMDRLETSDEVGAQALAMVALAKVLSGKNTDRVECLLAEAMDYDGHAGRLAESFSKSDPLRAYVLRDDQSLKQLAIQNQDMSTRYLLATRLAHLGKLEPWIDWMQKAFGDQEISISILKTGLEIDSFSLGRSFPAEMRAHILLALSRERENAPLDLKKEVIKVVLQNSAYYQVLQRAMKMDGDSLAATSQKFESSLNSLAGSYDGSFMPAEIHRAFYEAYFYSTLYIEGLNILDNRGNLEGAQLYYTNIKGLNAAGENRLKSAVTQAVSFVKDKATSIIGSGLSVGGTKKYISQTISSVININPVNEDLLLWFEHLVISQNGTNNLDDLVADLGERASLSGEALKRTFKEANRYFRPMDPAQALGVKRMAFRMDTRPLHKNILAGALHFKLYDLHLSDKLYQSVFETSPRHFDYTETWYRKFTGNSSRLKEIIHSPNWEFDTRVQALGYLEKLMSKPPKIIKNEYKKLIAEDPDSWYASKMFAKYLIEQKSHSEARKVVQAWLKREVPTLGLENTIALNLVAETYYEEGRYKEGWKVASRLIKGEQGGSFRIGALLLDKLGEKKKAEKIWQHYLQRYPHQKKAVANYAEFLWREGRYEDAGILVRKEKPHLSAWTFQFKIATKFAKVFADQPAEKGIEAFSFINRGLLPTEQEFFIYPLFRRGNPELAYRLESKLRRGGIGQIDLNLNAYRFLIAWKGKEAASTWIRNATPPGSYNNVGTVAFGKTEYDLLWSLSKSPDQFTWLMRAAASLKYEKISERERGFLMRYYKSGGMGGYYDKLGQYLLGLATKEEALMVLDTPKKVCEGAFYFGYKAHVEKRYGEAIDWYRIVIETGLTHNGEYHWAGNSLYHLWAEEVSLSRLKDIEDVWDIQSPKKLARREEG